ncbi:MAG: hypothetical protein ACRDYX_20745 [Egibacteraceae bacterium]
MVLDTLGFQALLRYERAHFLYLTEQDLASVEKSGMALLLDEPVAIQGKASAPSVQGGWR